MTQIAFTDAPEANELLANNHFALLVGMTLYQQVPVEKAFAGPYMLEQRMGEPLEAETIASMNPQRLEDLFREKPALHRFPANMAKRTQAVAAYILDTYGGDVSGLWDGVESAADIFARLKKMPGFGDYKAKVYAAVLARHFDVKPDGWDENLPDWPNISEVTTPESLTDMKSRKKAWKAAQS